MQISRNNKLCNKQELKDKELKNEILTIRDEHKNYGTERLTIALKRAKSVVHRIVKKFSLQIIRKRKKLVKPGDVDFKATEHKDLVKNICPIVPGEIWATNFTYLKFQNKTYYLATFIDIFSRKIQGWNLSDCHDTEFVLEALKRSINNAGQKPSICHSDQGSEYRGLVFQEVLETCGIQCSMSPKASPWRNGFQESFYAGFKNDLGDINRFNSVGELFEAIALTIKKYNSSRIHTALKMSPEQFLKNFYLNRKHTQVKAASGISLLEKVAS